jgi:hypothetical protein
MAKCPACAHGVGTPFFFNLDGWTHLACPQCKVRLEMKPPRSFLLAPLMAPLFVLARQGRALEVLAFVYGAVTIVLVLWESFHPKLRLRNKPRPQPEVRLNINGRSN